MTPVYDWLRQFNVFSKRTISRLVLAFVVLTVPVMAFVELAEEVGEGESLPVDQAILRTINAHASPLFDTAAVILTEFGGVIGVTVLTVGLATLLWGRGKRRMAALLVTGVGGTSVLNLVLKAVFQRDRPDLWERLVTENSYSFPSGHAMASSALALSIIVICWPTRWRWAGIAIGLIYMIVIGLTRLYLGVHYPSDVLAGWIVSAAWIATMVYVLTYRTTLRRLFTKKRP
jgi:membrane-associated phospholipid phosphatase